MGNKTLGVYFGKNSQAKVVLILKIFNKKDCQPIGISRLQMVEWFQSHILWLFYDAGSIPPFGQPFLFQENGVVVRDPAVYRYKI